MNAFETAAVVEDPSHLVLKNPVPHSAGQSCRVIVLFDSAEEKNWPTDYFEEVRINDPAFARPPQGTAPAITPLDE